MPGFVVYNVNIRRLVLTRRDIRYIYIYMYISDTGSNIYSLKCDFSEISKVTFVVKEQNMSFIKRVIQ